MAEAVFERNLTDEDVVNNLTSTSTDKPLSANMGNWLCNNLIDYIEVDLSNTAVTHGDSGWYYAEIAIPSSLPAGAMAISIQPFGNWDASVQYALLGNSQILIKSPTSLTLGSSRKVRVFYVSPLPSA